MISTVTNPLRALACLTLAAALCAVPLAASAQWFGKKAAPKGPPPPPIAPAPTCDKPLYLTLETGAMDTAPLLAEVLNKHQVKATFFVANEAANDGKGAMSFEWGQKFWAQRGQEGHDFASLTWDHVAFKGDVKGIAPQFVVQPGAGALAGRSFTWEPKKYCDQITQARERIEEFTTKKALPLWHSPSGTPSAKLNAAAQACGYQHASYTRAGLLGDSASSERASSDALVKKALASISAGDVLSAQLGSHKRQDPWPTSVLEPLIVGLKEKGFCFTTLRHHPSYTAWIAAHP